MQPDQLYGLRYGTVPVVRRVGGLANTVSDASPEALLADEATGFVFESAIVAALANALREAVRLYAQPKQWRQIMLHGMAWHGMAQNYSW